MVKERQRALGIEIQIFMVRGEEELDVAFAEMAKARVSAVIVQGSLPRKRAADLALKHRLATVSSVTGAFAEAGGLMSERTDSRGCISGGRSLRGQDSQGRKTR